MQYRKTFLVLLLFICTCGFTEENWRFNRFYKQGETAYSNGHYNTARLFFEQALNIYPNHSGTLLYLGTVHNIMGTYSSAVAYFNRLLNIDSHNPDGYFGRGLAYGHQKLYSSAIKDFRKVIKLAPDFRNGYISLGWYLTLNGEFKEAQKITLKAHQMGKDYVSYINLGHLAILNGNDESEVVEYYKNAMNLMKSYEDYKAWMDDLVIFVENKWKSSTFNEIANTLAKKFPQYYKRWAGITSSNTNTSPKKDICKYCYAGTCKDCNGTGNYTCAACGGSGTTYAPGNNNRCYSCNGSGISHKCSLCYGTGKCQVCSK